MPDVVVAEPSFMGRKKGGTRMPVSPFFVLKDLLHGDMECLWEKR